MVIGVDNAANSGEAKPSPAHKVCGDYWPCYAYFSKLTTGSKKERL